MSEPDFLSSSRIAILGLGLMGGSLALALRGKCTALLGVDPDPAALSLAHQEKIIDQGAGDPAEILTQADLIILAAPVLAIIELIRRLPELHPGAAVVLDLGSTKADVVTAMADLPDRFDPVGGHPMCGKEKLSLAHADPGLFQGAPFVFTSLPGTSPRARLLVEQLAQALGAYPVWLDAETHDRWAAATSHLPFLLASALVAATPGEVGALVGPGFRSTSRLAATSASMMLDVLFTNRQNILEVIERFREQLQAVEGLLSSNETAGLRNWLDRSAARHSELVGNSRRGDA